MIIIITKMKLHILGQSGIEGQKKNLNLFAKGNRGEGEKKECVKSKVLQKDEVA